MKKIITIICASIFSLSISAQSVDQGNMLIGTSSDFSISSYVPDGGDGEVAIKLQSHIGYFFMDYFAGGISINYISFDGETASGFGLFGRYYLMDGQMYLQSGFNTGDPLVKVNGFEIPFEDGATIDLVVGYAAWLNDQVTLEPALKYSILRSDGENIGTSLDLTMGLGFYF
tara:strand:+ start:240 stop:755 length:516 start_codon:yes stop_codon:yes gene_type:complete